MRPAQGHTRIRSWIKAKPVTATRASRDGNDERLKATSLRLHF